MLFPMPDLQGVDNAIVVGKSADRRLCSLRQRRLILQQSIAITAFRRLDRALDMDICLIPARGGSKRIPRKNIRPFQGRPMIGWSIQAAQHSGVFDQVIVSTDDEEIAETARDLGAEIPWMRPGDIANDYATTVDVVQHALLNLPGVKRLCCLYATAPFVRPDDLRQSLDLLSRDEDFVFPVTTFASPIDRSLVVNNEGLLKMRWPEQFATRSQDLPEAFHDVGMFYWGHAASWARCASPYDGDVKPFILPRYRVQDIDTEEDWARAELLAKVLREQEDCRSPR